MRAFGSAALFTAAMAYGLPAVAQQQTPAPQYVLAAYYRCDYNRQARSDTLYQRLNVPLLSRVRQEGKLSGYGLSAHRHGGSWRRLEYFTGSDINGLFQVQEEVGDAVAAQADGAEFTQICNSHDDYVWQQTLSGPAAAAGASPTAPLFSMSTYYECDPAREDRADAIVERVLAPILNRHVAAGHLTSWSWLEHVIGGPFRRVAVLRAADLATLLGGVSAVITDMRAAPENGEFSTICHRHTDYIWAPVVAG
jgi:hypothetical protein